MRKIKFTFLLIIIIINGCAFHSSFQTAKISIPTSQCRMCEFSIHKELSKLEGVKKIDINIEKQYVVVKYDYRNITLNDLEIAISNLGYKANNKSANMKAYNKLAECCKLPKDRKY